MSDPNCNESEKAGFAVAQCSAFRCARLDGQCAASWCDCERLMRAAIETNGNTASVMLRTRCSYTVAVRAVDWYRDTYSPNTVLSKPCTMESKNDQSTQ